MPDISPETHKILSDFQVDLTRQLNPDLQKRVGELIFENYQERTKFSSLTFTNLGKAIISLLPDDFLEDQEEPYLKHQEIKKFKKSVQDRASLRQRILPEVNKLANFSLGIDAEKVIAVLWENKPRYNVQNHAPSIAGAAITKELFQFLAGKPVSSNPAEVTVELLNTTNYHVYRTRRSGQGIRLLGGSATEGEKDGWGLICLEFTNTEGCKAFGRALPDTEREIFTKTPEQWGYDYSTQSINLEKFRVAANEYVVESKRILDAYHRRS